MLKISIFFHTSKNYVVIALICSVSSLATYCYSKLHSDQFVQVDKMSVLLSTSSIQVTDMSCEVVNNTPHESSLLVKGYTWF